MEGSPEAKGSPKAQRKPSGSKGGAKTIRSPRTSKKQVGSPDLLSQKGKGSASSRPDGPSSPQQQDGDANQPAIQSASIEAQTPSSRDILPGNTDSQEKASAFQPAASHLNAILPNQEPLFRDHEMGSAKAAVHTESSTLLPTSSDSAVTGAASVTGNQGTSKIVGAKLQPQKPVASKTTLSLHSDNAEKVVQAEELASVGPEKRVESPKARDEKRKGVSLKRQERPTTKKQRDVDADGGVLKQATLQDALSQVGSASSEAPSPITPDSLGDQGKESVSQMATNRADFVSSVQGQQETEDRKLPSSREYQTPKSNGLGLGAKDVPSKDNALDGVLSDEQEFSGDQERIEANIPVSSEKQVLATTSQAGSPASATSLVSSRRDPGRIIDAQPWTRAPTVSKTNSTPDKKCQTPNRAISPVPNLYQKFADGKTASPAGLRYFMDRRSDTPTPRTTATKQTFSTEIYAAIAVVMVAFIALLAFLLARGGPGNDEHEICRTPACEAYSRRLLASINRAVSPCESFTHYVCDGWRKEHELSVRQDTLKAALDSMYHAVSDLHDQDSADSAAIFYRSCACVGMGNCDQLPQVLSALREAGITWPRRTRSPDVLRTAIFSSLRLRWAGVLSFDVTPHGNEKHVAVHVANEFHLLKWKMDQQLRLSEEARKRYFEVLRDLFEATAGGGGKKANLVSFEETLYVEANIFNTLWHSVLLTRMMPVHDNVAYNVVPNLTRKRWTDTLRDCGVPLAPEDNIVLTTDAYYFFVQFTLLWRQHQEEAIHLFVSWCTVQVAALFSNQQLLVNFYGSQAKAELRHGFSCFSKTFLITGDDILYGYSDNFLPKTLRPAAEELVLDVRRAFHRRVLLWEHYSENATIVDDWNSTGVALTYFNDPVGRESNNRALTTMLRRADEQKPKFKTDSLVANWRLAVQDLHDDPKSFRLSQAIENQNLFQLHISEEGFRDFTLFPYAFTVPYFEKTVTRAFNYAGVGTRVAEALSLLFINAYYTWTGGSEAISDFVTCMEMNVSNKLSRRNYARHVEPVSLKIALDAYREKSKVLLREKPVIDLEWLSTEQLFFVAACFTRCTGGDDSNSDPMVQCDDTFKHVPEFATVFRCRPGAPMNPTERCKLL